MARKFKFEWRITLLVLFLLPLLVGLGFWQLHRADHNRAVMVQAEQQRKEPPISLTALLQETSSDSEKNKTDAWHLKQVTLRGHWLSNVFLVENQIYAERNGYYVFGVMQLEGAGLVLVNRGWIAAPALRSELPTVPPVALGDEMGEIYVSPAWVEHKPLFAEKGWPKRVGRINLAGAENELHMTLLPVVVRLREGSPSALATQWTIVNILPEKNTAYAIQWFAMAFALLVCYVFYSYRIESVKQ
jgi:cytochrome oxidase assembly protein ShyY1